MKTHPLPVRARLAHAVIAACLASFASLIPLTIAPGLAYAGSGGNGSGGNGHGSATSHKTPPSNTQSTSPTQPYSTADKNNTGANNTSPTNPYISNGTGEPTGNGVRNGNAKATGEPCAGCVGKADNKYPPGQHPNGSDPNAGYECDRNQGIGQTNPAHTGCQDLGVPSPTPGPSTPGCTPSSSEACTSTGSNSSSTAGGGLAQECANGNASACAAVTSSTKSALEACAAGSGSSCTNALETCADSGSTMCQAAFGACSGASSSRGCGAALSAFTACATGDMHACTTLTALPTFSSAIFSESPPASSATGCASSSGPSSAATCSPAEAGEATAAPAATGTLAFTGANLGNDLAAALALIVLGAGVLGARRMSEH